MRRLLSLPVLLTAMAGWAAAGAIAAPSPAAQQIADAARQTTRAARRPEARAAALIQVAGGFVAAGQPDAAAEAMRQAIEAAEAADARRQMLLEAGEACVRLRLDDLALDVVRRTDYAPHAIHILCALAEAEAAGGLDPSEALARAEERAAQIPEPEAAARAWLRIGSAALSGGLEDRCLQAVAHAVEQAARARSSLITATLLEQVVDLSLQAGRPADATRQAEMIDVPDVAVPVAIRVAKALQADDPEQAAALTERAARTARAADSPYRRALLLARTAVGFDSLGNAAAATDTFAEARRLADQVQDELRAATVRSALVDALIATRRWPDAESVALLDKDAFRKGEQLVRIALALEKAGEYAEAVRVAGLADADYLKYGGTPNLRTLGLAYYKAWGPTAETARLDALKPPELRDAVLYVYAEQLADAGKQEAALRHADMVGFAVTRADAIVGVALHSAREAASGAELAFAEGCLDRLEVASDRMRVLAAIALRQAQLGLTDASADTLEQLLATRKEAPTEAGRATASGEAATVFTLLGRDERARTTATEAMQDALKVGCAGCRDEVIEDLLDELSRLGDLSCAIAALDVIETPSLRAANALRLLGLKPDAPRPQRERLARIALKAAVKVASLDKRVEMLLATADEYARDGLALTGDEQKALRESYEDLPADAAWHTAVKGDPSRQGPAPIKLVFFDRAGCARCDEVKGEFDQLREMYPTLEIEVYNLTNSEAATLLNDSICRNLKVPEEQHLVAPSLFSLRRGLVGDDLSLSSMAELAEEARGMPSPARAYAPVDEETGRSRMKERYEKIGLFVVVTAGLLDGINPCAFSVIIFFLSYLAYLGKDRREIAAVGIVFTLAVFMTYFGIGLFLSGLVTAADAWSGHVTRIIYGATAVLAFVVAALSFRDALRCRRGQVHDMSLSLPESLRSRIRLTISRRARMGLTIGATLVLGAIVAFFEAPCTGQVYLPTIVYALENLPQYAWGPVGWLLLYNVCFILPLIAVFVAVMFGLTSEHLTALFRRHLAKAKFAMAGFFFVLGSLMVAYLFRS